MGLLILHFIFAISNKGDLSLTLQLTGIRFVSLEIYGNEIQNQVAVFWVKSCIRVAIKPHVYIYIFVQTTMTVTAPRKGVLWSRNDLVSW